MTVAVHRGPGAIDASHPRRGGRARAGLACRDALGLWSGPGPARRAPAGRDAGEASIVTEHSTEALIVRCAGGDMEAFRMLYAAQSPRLNGLALRITREPALAADAVQETFLQVWRRAERFDGQRGSAEAWLSGLVRYRAIDIVRSRQREQVGGDFPEEASREADALEQLTASADGAALHACMQHLADGPRRLLVWAFIEGLSHSQLAARVGEPLGTVKGRIRRSLLALKRCLEP